jgi:hypothetical protein
MRESYRDEKRFHDDAIAPLPGPVEELGLDAAVDLIHVQQSDPFLSMGLPTALFKRIPGWLAYALPDTAHG